ncbi:MAG: nucleoside-diphosphate kinase [Chloroflexi bacterium]|nr:nucleoside-diphosphate kinase [Chloroflexota bacterium]
MSAKASQRTLVLIKPDAIQRGLSGAVISRLEGRGLRIVAMKMLHMDEAMAQRHYAVHEGKAFFKGLVEFITSSPIIAIVFEGQDAVEVVRRTMGETDPVKAQPGTIRGDYALDIGHNLVHGSDSLETAGKEIALFFNPGEILGYKRQIDAWIVGGQP